MHRHFNALQRDAPRCGSLFLLSLRRCPLLLANCQPRKYQPARANLGPKSKGHWHGVPQSVLYLRRATISSARAIGG